MTTTFKNKERQALLEDLLSLCQKMAEYGIKEDTQRHIRGSARLGLSCRASKEENALYLDLITSDNQYLQPFTIQVYMKENNPWVYLYYFDKNKVNKVVNEPLIEVQTTLADLISGILSQSRVCAFHSALYWFLGSYIEWSSLKVGKFYG